MLKFHKPVSSIENSWVPDSYIPRQTCRSGTQLLQILYIKNYFSHQTYPFPCLPYPIWWLWYLASYSKDQNSESFQTNSALPTTSST